MTVVILARIFASFLAMIVIMKTWISFRKRQESRTMLLFWLVTWTLIIVIAFFPDLVTELLGERKVGVGTLLGIGLVFVYFVVYRIYAKADRIEKDLAKLVRRISIEGSGFSSEQKRSKLTSTEQRPKRKSKLH